MMKQTNTITIQYSSVLSAFPELQKKPKLIMTIDEVTKKVNFTCSFERLKETSYLYFITYLLDDVNIMRPSLDTDSSFLSEDSLINLTYNSKVSLPHTSS